MKRVIVPATSANLGPGFDSMGVAVQLFLTIDIIGESDEWLIEHNVGNNIPTDKSNMVIQTILTVAPETKPHHLQMKSEIPPARGLGSSSSAIVAGIEIADTLNDKRWTTNEKINLANQLEGHPDNIAPAIAGGLVIAVAINDDEVLWDKQTFPNAAFIVTIPNDELLTSDARRVLPDTLPFKEAVRASGIGNVLASKLMSGDLASAGRLMEMDLFHEPYRCRLVPQLSQIRTITKGLAGVYGTYLSGAGPTIMTLANEVHASDIAKIIENQIENAVVKVLALDHEGSRVIEVDG